MSLTCPPNISPGVVLKFYWTEGGGYGQETLHSCGTMTGGRSNMKGALKCVLQNENIHTTIPGFTTFDQLKMDISIMEDFTLTEKEKSDLDSIKKLSDGLYCCQCGRCQTQCPAGIDIPTLMRAYMYAYGYRNLSLAKDTLQSLRLSPIPCTNCPTCNVNCSMGFDIRNRILDITRLQNIPEDFLV